MLPLNDMIAQNGQAMELLARQFNLTQQQTQAAVAALLPAFSQGLKRSTSDPYGVGAFLTALATGQHAKYFDNPASAFAPAGIADGNGILGHLFGSPDLSRAVAQQASIATGVGQEVMKQMLPAIAAMIMGGLFKQTTGQLGPTPQPNFGGGFGAGNPLGDIIGEMMRQGGGALGGGLGGMLGGGQPRNAPAQNPMDNPFGKILEGMFGGGQQQPQQREAQSPYGDNPLGKIFEEMMRGGQPRAEPQPRSQPQGGGLGDNPFGRMMEDMLGGGRREPDPEPAPAPRPRENPSGRARTPYDDLFGDMFETGARQRDDYQKNMESVFDQFLKGMDRKR